MGMFLCGSLSGGSGFVELVKSGIHACSYEGCVPSHHIFTLSSTNFVQSPHCEQLNKIFPTQLEQAQMNVVCKSYHVLKFWSNKKIFDRDDMWHHYYVTPGLYKCGRGIVHMVTWHYINDEVALYEW